MYFEEISAIIKVNLRKLGGRTLLRAVCPGEHARRNSGPQLGTIGSNAMIDQYGRTIDYLRLSVTDLCNYRCQYCMPPEGVEKRLHSDILSIEELAEIAAARNGNFAAMKANSKCLSSDVTACFDPNFADVFDRRNVSLINCGVAMSKYTGHGGKVGTNDAPAEYVAWIRRIMADAGVIWQAGDMGKDDVGGGGTIAYILSLYGMEVIDCGVAVLNMHAPWEITSKADIYEAYKCYKVFLKEA